MLHRRKILRRNLSILTAYIWIRLWRWTESRRRYTVYIMLYLLSTTVCDQYECCGAASYLDWADSAWSASQLVAKVPDSCCKSPGPGCGARDHPSNIHYTGCVHRCPSRDILPPPATGL